MEKSTDIINKAKERFKELEHKNFEWRSFYNGYLEAKAEQLALLRVSCQREQLVCEYDNIIDRSLTKGKTYKKIHEHKGMVVIINDFDEVMSYNKEAFFEQTNCN